MRHTRARIRGRLQLQKIVGRNVSGLVPPAWRLASNITDLKESGIDYTLAFSRLETASGRNVALATFSWDWGRLAFLSRGGGRLGRCLELWNRRAVPVIVIHPADVRRGHTRCAVEVIRRLKSAARSRSALAICCRKRERAPSLLRGDCPRFQRRLKRERAGNWTIGAPLTSRGRGTFACP